MRFCLTLDPKSKKAHGRLSAERRTLNLKRQILKRNARHWDQYFICSVFCHNGDAFVLKTKTPHEIKSCRRVQLAVSEDDLYIKCDLENLDSPVDICHGLFCLQRVTKSETACSSHNEIYGIATNIYVQKLSPRICFCFPKPIIPEDVKKRPSISRPR